MFSWAVTFFIIALIAAVLGFSGIAGTAVNIAWILAVIGIILALVFMVMGRRFFCCYWVLQEASCRGVSTGFSKRRSCGSAGLRYLSLKRDANIAFLKDSRRCLR